MPSAVPSASENPDPGRFQRRLTGYAAALATVVIWALWMVGTRHAVTHSLDPAAVGILRFAVPALVLAPVWWRTGPLPKGVSPLVLLCLLGSGTPFFLTVATGMKFAPAPDVGPLLPGTMPLFVALIGMVVFRERLGGWRGLGMVLIAIGVLCIGGRGLADTASGSWRGHILFLAGALMWGIYTHAYRRSGLDPLKAAAIIGLWSIVILLPFGASPLAHALASGLAGPIVLQAILQGFLSGVVAIVLYGVAIDRLGASQAAALSPLGPVLATLIAMPVLGEYPDAAALVGLVVAAAGVVLASGIVHSGWLRRPAGASPPVTASAPRPAAE